LQYTFSASLIKTRHQVAFLSSLLFLSTTGSSRLMTLLSVYIHFSMDILFSTHVLSPHLSIANIFLPKISLSQK
jgi:hypothetical protein